VDLIPYLELATEEVNKALAYYLPPDDNKLHQAMRYSVLGEGKRLRPILVVATAELGGLERQKVMPLACAIEFLHSYTLIHDDLPAMDNDDWRRGKPSCHRVFGEDIAILAGDALQALCFELLTLLSANFPPLKVVEVAKEVALAAGSKGVIGGQLKDLELENITTIQEKELLEVYEKKTSVLFEVAVRSAAKLSGLNEQSLNQLTSYGYYLGLAFQITDDILDMETEKRSALSLLTQDKAQALEMARSYTKKAQEALLPLGESGQVLKEIAAYLLDRNK